MSDLLVFIYDSEDKATEVLRRVATAKKDNVHEALVSIRDAAIATKKANGKVKVGQTLEAMVKGSRVLGGGFWGILIGLLFGGPLVGGLIGMGLRAFGNRSIDIGIDNTFITEVSGALDPGQSALFLLTENTEPAVVNEALGQHDGTLYHTSLSVEAAEALDELAEHEDVAAVLSEDE